MSKGGVLLFLLFKHIAPKLWEKSNVFLQITYMHNYAVHVRRGMQAKKDKSGSDTSTQVRPEAQELRYHLLPPGILKVKVSIRQ